MKDKVTITIELPRKLHERIIELADKDFKSKSQVVREVLIKELL